MPSRLLKCFLDLRLDFHQTVVLYQGGSGGLDYFDIKPRDFIRYAKEDFKAGDQKGLVNSLTNSKRAIDCQIDTTLKYFGIAYDKISKSSEPLVQDLALSKKALPHKLKLVQALGFAPSGLTSKVRTLRNKLEHYYKFPSIDEIEEALEISELFILSVESKTKMVDDDFLMSSSDFVYKAPHYSIPEYDVDHYANSIQIRFDYKAKKFLIIPTYEKVESRKFSFTHEQSEFYFLLRLVNSIDDKVDFLDALRLLLTHIQHPIPSPRVRIDEFA